MSVPSAFESQLYIHEMVLMSRAVGRISEKIVQNAVSSTTTGSEFQPVQKAWDALNESCLLGLL